jgi:hypothetical protein
MIIRGMNLSLIIACILIVLALLIFPLFISYKSEKEESEWAKIKNYGDKINNKTRKNK